MGVMCAQSPLESDLIQRCQQLQSRLSTLKIENDEVGHVSFLLLVLFINLASHTFHLCCLLIPACFMSFCLAAIQVKKTMEATLSTIQDMVTVEDYDVSECFQHSNSMESVKSTCESYLSKPSLAKRRANQQETEQFYFTVSSN